MSRVRVLGALAVVTAAGLTPAWAADGPFGFYNPLGFYVGGGVGQSDLRSDDVFGDDSRFDRHHTGWKAFAGVRPIPFLGAEIEYVDFGNPDYYDYNYSGGYNDPGSVHSRATAAFGVAYLPVPLPWVDVFGKVGAARLQTTGSSGGVYCFDSSQCPMSYRIDRTDTDLAYGAGVQLKLPWIAFRAEYERIAESHGNPDLLSVGVAWTF